MWKCIVDLSRCYGVYFCFEFQMTEVWTSEELLEVWELKIFQEKLEKQIKERQQEKVMFYHYYVYYYYYYCLYSYKHSIFKTFCVFYDLIGFFNAVSSQNMPEQTRFKLLKVVRHYKETHYFAILTLLDHCLPWQTSVHLYRIYKDKPQITQSSNLFLTYSQFL